MANINTTYVYFRVQDYTGNYSLSTYTLENTPLSFLPDFSTSSILSGNRTISNKALHWDFGDGTFSNDLQPSHVYTWPGIYNVTLTIYDNAGNAYDSSYAASIQVYDYVSSQISFEDYKGLIYDVPAGRLIDPLYVNVYNSWQNYVALSGIGYTINFYASGASGDYNYTQLSKSDKWNHLRSLSRFYRTQKTGNNIYEYVEIESLTATQSEIYVNIQNNQITPCSKYDTGSVLAGVTGNCQIWYTDDRPGNLTTENNPVILFASIDNSKFNDQFTQKNNAFEYINYPPFGFQNINPAVFPIVKVRYNPASRLSITTTGIDGEGSLSTTKFEIPKISWQETEIPYVIKFKDEYGFTTKNYPPLSSSLTINTQSTPQPYNDLQTGIVTLQDGKYIPLEGVTFYEDFTSQAPQSMGSFFKGYFIASQSSENCMLTAAVTVQEPAHYQSDALAGWITIPQYNIAQRILRQEVINGIDQTKIITLGNSTTQYQIANNRNLYAIAVSPAGTDTVNDYQTWFADAVNDVIVKYDIYGNQLPDYYALSAMPTLINNQITIIDYRTPANNNTLAAAAPNNIVLDRNENIWVTLFDSGTAIKIDTVKGVVVNTAAPNTSNLNLSLSSDYITQQGFAGENLILPSSLDVDFNNDVWISYNHPDYSHLIKYRGDGNFTNAADILVDIQFPENVVPEEICIDRNQYVWVSALNLNNRGTNFNTFNDLVFKYDINGNLVDGFPLSGFNQIGNITVDGNQNAWVAHNRETITKIDGLTNKTLDYIGGLGINTTEYIGSIGGIICDTSNYIWVINNFDKKLYIINTAANPTPFLSYVTSVDLTFPTTNIPVLSSYTTPISIVPDQYSDGIQAFQAIGDWNGYKWLNKYASPKSTVRTITGASNLFNIYSSQGKNNISKINENWGAADYYDSLRFQESLLDKQVFFDHFLGVIVGGLSAQPYELGKTVYEKISNFTKNKADISTVNLDSLLAFCKELAVDFEEYNYLFPPQIRRLVDLLSIKQSILWGTQNKYAQNFNARGTSLPNSIYGKNLGPKINILTDTITSGVPIVANELFSNTYKIVNTNYIDDPGTVIPLSTYSPNWGWELSLTSDVQGVDIDTYYSFYIYNNTYENSFYNNIIDWNNELTTLLPSNSAYNDWSNDDGIIQTLLSYELTKGFKLFTSAVNITYNS